MMMKSRRINRWSPTESQIALMTKIAGCKLPSKSNTSYRKRNKHQPSRWPLCRSGAITGDTEPTRPAAIEVR
jgi:hypothetical protein